MDARPAPRGRRGTWIWFAAICLVALGARALHVSQVQTSPLTRAPILDEKVHHEWAAQFAAGEPWSVDRATGAPQPYFRAPLYIWFLGTVYKLFGVDPALAPRVIQAVLMPRAAAPPTSTTSSRANRRPPGRKRKRPSPRTEAWHFFHGSRARSFSEAPPGTLSKLLGPCDRARLDRDRSLWLPLSPLLVLWDRSLLERPLTPL